MCSILNAQPPQLIVQIVVDQLRGDRLLTYRQQFGENGFNYLFKHGINYQNTHQPHANTTTCAGHATISTGSYPAMHGIVNNHWFDKKLQKTIYCMEDLDVKNLPPHNSDLPGPGRSPKNLSSSTIADEIILSRKGRAFSVSFKDRAAVALIGRAGKAIWFDTKNGGFTSSSFYYKELPKWLQSWNRSYQMKDFDWVPGQDLNNYQNASSPTIKHSDTTFANNFPHHVIHSSDKSYFKLLSKTPQADRYTAEIATLLIKSELLGSAKTKTDYLAISFSAVDAIGHQFGPNSLESEDNLLELDKTIAQLLKVLDKQVGLNNTLIILTADHGINEGPAFLKNHHFSKINPLDINELKKNIEFILNNKYHLPASTLQKITFPYIYFDPISIYKSGFIPWEISNYIANELSNSAGIFKAYALPVKLQKDWLNSKVSKMFFPDRSGDIYIIQPPNESNGSKNLERVAHGSPWNYDSYIPLIFSSGKFKPEISFKPAYSTDIAVTLSALLDIKPPSAAVGTPLIKVLKSWSNEQTSPQKKYHKFHKLNNY